MTEQTTHKQGRPPKYNNPEELQAKITQYFAEYPMERQTMTGLALFLGFTSRIGFWRYGNNEGNTEEGLSEGFCNTYARARSKIEESYEICLKTAKSAQGPMFALKQMGWIDKTEQDINQRIDGQVSVNLGGTKVSVNVAG
jgi:hypothetical protein